MKGSFPFSASPGSRPAPRPPPPPRPRRHQVLVPITVRGRRSSSSRRRSTGQRRCRHGGCRSSGPGSPSSKARARGWLPPPWQALLHWSSAGASLVAGTRAQPPWAAGRPGRCRPSPLLWVRFGCGSPAEPRLREGEGRVQLCAPGSWQRRPRLEVKVSGPGGSPPLALLSGVHGLEAAPQRPEPGAASAQRLQPPPLDSNRGAAPADPLAVTEPPKLVA